MVQSKLHTVVIMARPVLPLCYYGKALDLMIKNIKFTKKTLDHKYVSCESKKLTCTQ